MNLKKIAVLALVLCLMSGLLPASSLAENAPINRRIDKNTAKSLDFQPEAAKARIDTLVIGVLDLLGEVNPFWAQTTGDHYTASLLYDELLFANNAGEMGAGVASFTKTADGKTYTFTIADTVRYTDGTPVSSDDFINALYLLTMPYYDGCYDITDAAIEGVQAYVSGEATSISGITRVSDKAFSITFLYSNPDNLVFLAFPALRVSLFGDMRRPDDLVNPEAFRAFYESTLKTVRATDATGMTYGQYALADLEPGVKAVFTKNDTYWRGVPYIGNLELLVVPAGKELDSILEGQVDIISMLGSIEAVDAVADFEKGFINLYTWEGDVIGYLGMDLKSSIFSDLRVRQALAMGFDRDAARLNRLERYGYVLKTILFDSFSASADDVTDEQFPFDQERAAELLHEAGWQLADDGIRYRHGNPLAFTLTYNVPNPIMDAVVQQMQTDYQALGIKLTLDPVPFETLVSRVAEGSCDMYFEARRLPSSPLVAADLFAGDSHLNTSGYNSDSIDRFLRMAEQETDPDRQMLIYELLFQELYSELPFIPLYRRSEFLLVNARVMNVTITTAHDITADAYRYFFTDTLEGQW